MMLTYLMNHWYSTNESLDFSLTLPKLLFDIFARPSSAVPLWSSAPLVLSSLTGPLDKCGPGDRCATPKTRNNGADICHPRYLLYFYSFFLLFFLCVCFSQYCPIYECVVESYSPEQEGFHQENTCSSFLLDHIFHPGPQQVKRHNAGHFPFFVPALVFHAWLIDGVIGLMWAASKGREGFKMLCHGETTRKDLEEKTGEAQEKWGGLGGWFGLLVEMPPSCCGSKRLEGWKGPVLRCMAIEQNNHKISMVRGVLGPWFCVKGCKFWRHQGGVRTCFGASSLQHRSLWLVTCHLSESEGLTRMKLCLEQITRTVSRTRFRVCWNHQAHHVFSFFTIPNIFQLPIWPQVEFHVHRASGCWHL